MKKQPCECSRGTAEHGANAAAPNPVQPIDDFTFLASRPGARGLPMRGPVTPQSAATFEANGRRMSWLTADAARNACRTQGRSFGLSTGELSMRTVYAGLVGLAACALAA